MSEPKPPLIATVVELDGARDEHRFVRSILLRLGADVGAELGVGTQSLETLPTSAIDAKMSERNERTAWSFGAIEVERDYWTLWDPNDRMDSSGTSRLVWRIRGLADGRSLTLVWEGARIDVHMSPSSTLALTALVHLAHVETATPEPE